jgi:hypothetical protein
LINPSDPTFEQAWLDFKAGDRLSDPDIKKVWSESLSAFANTEGGVLIFGINAKKTPSAIDPSVRIDAASDIAPVPLPAALRSRLMELHHVATDPPIPGVEVEHVGDPAGGGYVVCYIPEGNAKPYRAENVKNHPYYIRIGDDSVIPPPSILRNLFFPQTRMSLQFTITSWCRKSERDQILGYPGTPTISINVKNVGAKSVRGLLVQLAANGTHASWSRPNCCYLWTERPMLGAWGVSLNNTLHPGEATPVGDCVLIKQNDVPSDDVTKVKGLVFAEDASAQEFEITIADFGTGGVHDVLSSPCDPPF